MVIPFEFIETINEEAKAVPLAVLTFQFPKRFVQLTSGPRTISIRSVGLEVNLGPSTGCDDWYKTRAFPEDFVHHRLQKAFDRLLHICARIPKEEFSQDYVSIRKLSPMVDSFW